MNPVLVLSLLRQRLTSPMRVTIIVLTAGMSVLMAVALRSFAPLDNLAGVLALVFAAGAIGQDLASGVLQLTFARPLTRRSYVLSRWGGAVAGAWLAHSLVLGLCAVLLAIRGVPMDALPVRMLEAGLGIAATAAVLVGFSSLVRGLGDLALYGASLFIPALLAQVARARGELWLERAAAEVGRTVQPDLRLGFLLHGGPVPWSALATWASTAVLFLAIAITVMNRREVSYGDG